MPIQHPEATNAMWPRCPNTIARKFMLGGWDLRCTDFSNDIQICPCHFHTPVISCYIGFSHSWYAKPEAPKCAPAALDLCIWQLARLPRRWEWRHSRSTVKICQNPGSRQQQQRQTPEWFGMSWFWQIGIDAESSMKARCLLWARWDGANFLHYSSVLWNLNPKLDEPHSKRLFFGNNSGHKQMRKGCEIWSFRKRLELGNVWYTRDTCGCLTMFDHVWCSCWLVFRQRPRILWGSCWA